ncbi:MAG: helix-hairpin-helix domain-containing protein [Candidatus Hydrogenedentes bacterium]|nr:helix-hairpin-helix domain-containing protein [Candidatus Hydrogenedentota bacterium]
MITAEKIQMFAETVKFNKEKILNLIDFINQGYHLDYIYYYKRDEVGIENWNFLVSIYDRYRKFVELENKKQETLAILEKNDMLNDELAEAVKNAKDYFVLDDILLPIKRKTPGRSKKAIQQGLSELADYILKQLPVQEPLEITAQSFVNSAKGVSTPEEALQGAITILSEKIEQDYKARYIVKKLFLEKGVLTTSSTKPAQTQRTQFEAYHDFKKPIRNVGSIQFLQIIRGMKIGFLKVSIDIDESLVIDELLKVYLKEKGSVFENHIRMSIKEAFKRQLRTICENRAIEELREEVERNFLADMRSSLQEVLMFPPCNVDVILSLMPSEDEDWGICVVDKDGNLLESSLVPPTTSGLQYSETQEKVKKYIETYQIKHIVVGNSKGVEDAFQFVGELVSNYRNPRIRYVTYESRYAENFSHTRIAEIEVPNHPKKIKEAYYLAKCFINPLRELMKLPPVYLPDGILHKEVNEKKFNIAVNQVIEHCVNTVGVDLNKATYHELKCVAGIRNELAQNIIQARSNNGGFKTRSELLSVPGMTEELFKQCSGFLFINGGTNPLDKTRIHPDWYSAIESCANELNITIESLFTSFKNVKLLINALENKKLLGREAIRLITKELRSPGRDPRGVFVFPRYSDGIYRVSDLRVGMQTEGIIKKFTDTNVIVDIGIPIDGVIWTKNNPSLTRMSKAKLLDKKIGDFVKVNIESIDLDNNRVILIPYFPQRLEKENRREKKENSGVATVDNALSENRKIREEKVRREPSMHQKDTYKSKDDYLVNTQLAEQLSALKDKLSP